MTMNLPIIDLHCDLLHYLSNAKTASLQAKDDIGVAIPHLLKGNVKFQVCAIYSATETRSALNGFLQSMKFDHLISNEHFSPVRTLGELTEIEDNQKIGIVAAIENASAFGEEDMSMEECFVQFDRLMDQVRKLLYISFTHHTENRFGGGNYSDNVGLKEDGKTLLEYLSGKQIAVDLSHSSDALAHDIFNYIDQKNLDVSVIASHSNFRTVWNHVRNLPDELAKEIIKRNGIIGINFLRAYGHDEKPEHLFEHFLYAFNELGAEDHICFGADFFYVKNFPDPSRYPLFFKPFENAGQYPFVLSQLAEKGLSEKQLEKLASGNAMAYLKRQWSEKT